MTTQDDEPWTVWLAIRGVFELVRANFVTFFVVAFAFNLPLLLAEMLPFAFVMTTVAGFVCVAGLSVSFTDGVLRAMGGDTPEAGAMLAQIARPDAIRLLILNFCQNVGVGLGLCLLVLPGLYLIARWIVAVPVMMVKKTSVGAALRRSSELTVGRRSSVIAVFLACLAVFLVPYLVVVLPLLSIAGISVDSTWFTAVSVITGSLASLILYCIPPVLYLFLRHEKEGTAIEDIVEALA